MSTRAAQAPQDALSFFVREGYAELPGLLDANAARELFNRAKALHALDSSIFLSQAAWEASEKSHKGTNPRPGNNALEKVAVGGYDPLAFLKDNAAFMQHMEGLLGKNFKWIFGKLVCRLAPSALPGWLAKQIEGAPANTLGAFMPKEYRDFTYLLDTDLHQDIQDYFGIPEAMRDHRFITLYVYLNDVTEQEAPITMLPRSQLFGATPYQHDVTYQRDTKDWLYRTPEGKEMHTTLKPLMGPAGYAGCWHSCMLHGSNTPPADGRLRISLRLLLGRSDDATPCALDAANDAINGPLYLQKDYSPGYNAKGDGLWGLAMTDYMKLGYGLL
ncbi:MAG: phytanoyl-CoA dioxygenase family protein [Rickettsiales bacterium]|nr:phytanoyl-CoA dioxygenase family protein [Rickettsiales bacterium]